MTPQIKLLFQLALSALYEHGVLRREQRFDFILQPVSLFDFDDRRFYNRHPFARQRVVGECGGHDAHSYLREGESTM